MKYYAIINGTEKLVRTSENNYRYACLGLNIFTSKDKEYLISKVYNQCFESVNSKRFGINANTKHTVWDNENHCEKKLTNDEWKKIVEEIKNKCQQSYERALATIVEVYTK